jgi:hypothetical protein
MAAVPPDDAFVWARIHATAIYGRPRSRQTWPGEGIVRGRIAGALGVMATMVIVGAAFAQPAIPNGVFVRESNGTVWLVLNGERVNVPMWAASDE